MSDTETEQVPETPQEQKKDIYVIVDDDDQEEARNKVEEGAISRQGTISTQDADAVEEEQSAFKTPVKRKRRQPRRRIITEDSSEEPPKKEYKSHALVEDLRELSHLLDCFRRRFTELEERVETAIANRQKKA